MSIATHQRQIFLDLLNQIRPFWRTDPGLPIRIQRAIAGNRKFGSRDRRLYRELLYTAVRFLPWVEVELDSHPEAGAALVGWLAADTTATRDFRAELTGEWPSCPEGIHARAEILGKDPLALVPSWLGEECPEIYTPPQLDALHRRGRLWLRFRSGRTQSAELPKVDAAHVAPGERSGRTFGGGEGEWRLVPSDLFPEASEAIGEGDLTRTPEFLRGDFEVQDLGSQMILGSLGDLPGNRWLDACAGAGGKTLQLADLLERKGSVDAFDIRKEALEELSSRAARSGYENIRVLTVPPSQMYDGVLLDLPCSGSGTWRRSPHLKWTTTRDVLHRHAARQASLLRAFSQRVRPGGGVLVYATCSLAKSENSLVVKKFLEEFSDFESIEPTRDFGFRKEKDGLAILPALHDTDGFFVACLRRQ